MVTPCKGKLGFYNFVKKGDKLSKNSRCNKLGQLHRVKKTQKDRLFSNVIKYLFRPQLKFKTYCI